MSQGWISDRLIELGKSQAELARVLALPSPRIAEMITDKRKVKTSELIPLAAFLELPIEEVLGLLGDSPADVLVSSATKSTPPRKGKVKNAENHKQILEVDVYGGMGGGGVAAFHNHTDSSGNTTVADDIRTTWEMPIEYIAELRLSAEKARIIEVQGDSMEPTLRTGDRVMINTADKRPSPPGIFAVWDGFGVVVKRVEPIPNSDPPTLRIISDNQHHGTYERTLDEVNIIGRVVWFARRL